MKTFFPPYTIVFRLLSAYLSTYIIPCVFLCSLFAFIGSTSQSHAQTNRNFPIARTGKVSVTDTASMRLAARKYFLKGMEYRLVRDYTSAILELQLALRYDSSATIAYTVAQSYAQLGKKDIALEYLAVSIRKNPDYIPALELQAEFAIEDNRLLGALEIYEHIVALQPKNRQSRYMLGRILEFSNEQKAITIYNSLIEDFGSDEQLLERLVYLYRSQNDTTSYIRTLEKILDSGTDNDVIAREYIQQLLRSRNYLKAVQFLSSTQALSKTNSLPSLFSAVADNFLSLDSSALILNKKTVSELLMLIKKNHFLQWQLPYAAAMLSYRLGDKKQSEQFFYDAELLTDSHAEFMLEQGRFYSQNNDDDNAVNVLKTGITLFSEDYRFPFYIGVLYDNMHNNDSAQKYYYMAVSIEHGRSEIWAQLGIFHNRNHNNLASDTCYRRGLLLSPDDALLNNNLAYTFAERKIFLDQALIMAQKAVAKEPMNSSYLDTYGWVLFQMGNYDKSIAQLKQALLYSNSATLYEHIGSAYFESGDYTEAKQAFTKALELDPKKIYLQQKIDELKK